MGATAVLTHDPSAEQLTSDGFCRVVLANWHRCMLERPPTAPSDPLRPHMPETPSAPAYHAGGVGWERVSSALMLPRFRLFFL